MVFKNDTKVMTFENISQAAIIQQQQLVMQQQQQQWGMAGMGVQAPQDMYSQYASTAGLPGRIHTHSLSLTHTCTHTFTVTYIHTHRHV